MKPLLARSAANQPDVFQLAVADLAQNSTERLLVIGHVRGRRVVVCGPSSGSNRTDGARARHGARLAEGRIAVVGAQLGPGQRRRIDQRGAARWLVHPPQCDGAVGQHGQRVRRVDKARCRGEVVGDLFGGQRGGIDRHVVQPTVAPAAARGIVLADVDGDVRTGGTIGRAGGDRRHDLDAVEVHAADVRGRVVAQRIVVPAGDGRSGLCEPILVEGATAIDHNARQAVLPLPSGCIRKPLAPCSAANQPSIFQVGVADLAHISTVKLFVMGKFVTWAASLAPLVGSNRTDYVPVAWAAG